MVWNPDKSFLTEQEAKDFVAGKATGSKDGEQRFYGVAVGHVPGVYTEWIEAQEQIRDVKGPKYKRFETRAEAEEFVRTAGKSSTPVEFLKGKKVDTNGSTGDEPIAKKVKMSADTLSLKGKGLKVYTDGSSRGNGRLGALAGVGVYFGDNDPRYDSPESSHYVVVPAHTIYSNVSEPLKGTPQTNQRAELTAIVRALELAPEDCDMEIITDSKYSIDCSTNWYKNWMRNGWRTSTGGDVTNKDLVVAIRALIDKRDGRGVNTKFTWIKGHDNDPGNTAADLLAVAGSRRT